MGLLDRIKSKLGAGETGTEAAAASERSIETPRKSVASAQVIEEELRLQVANHSQGEFSIDDIPTDAALFDEAFIDSISSVKFLSFIEQNYGVKIKEVALVGNLASIEALAEHILAKCPAPGETEPAE